MPLPPKRPIGRVALRFVSCFHPTRPLPLFSPDPRIPHFLCFRFLKSGNAFFAPLSTAFLFLSSEDGLAFLHCNIRVLSIDFSVDNLCPVGASDKEGFWFCVVFTPSYSVMVPNQMIHRSYLYYMRVPFGLTLNHSLFPSFLHELHDFLFQDLKFSLSSSLRSFLIVFTRRDLTDEDCTKLLSRIHQLHKLVDLGTVEAFLPPSWVNTSHSFSSLARERQVLL